MKVFLSAVTVICFMFGVISGASLNTVASMNVNHLLIMSLNELTNISV